MEIWINLFLVFLLWNILAIIAVIYRDKWINGLNIFKEKKNVKQRHSTKGHRVVRKNNSQQSRPKSKRSTRATAKSRVRSKR